jgi:hypothetical protein
VARFIRGLLGCFHGDTNEQEKEISYRFFCPIQMGARSI